MKILVNEPREKAEKIVGTYKKLILLVIYHFSIGVIAIIFRDTNLHSTIVLFGIFLGPSYYAWLMHDLLLHGKNMEGKKLDTH